MGSGVYGTVFRAKEIKTGRSCAIKRAKVFDEPDDCGLSVNMVREATILNSFSSHPNKNILNLRDFFFRNHRIYLVFDDYFCNLREHLSELEANGKTMLQTQLESFMRQILSALAFCHERRVLHRDMKPDNILLDERKQRLVICDFGMAKTFSQGECFTENCITPWYRPPEMLLGDVMYGPAVDMWSAGMILAEMINLKPVLSQAKTDIDCLKFLFESLGTPTERSWPGVTSLPFFRHRAQIPSVALLPGSVVLVSSNVSSVAAELVDRILVLCPSGRISAADALTSQVFFQKSWNEGDISDRSTKSGRLQSHAPSDVNAELPEKRKRRDADRIDEKCLLCDEIIDFSDYIGQTEVVGKSRRIDCSQDSMQALQGFVHDFGSPPFSR
jgi:serine/threonine protein kinase